MTFFPETSGSTTVSHLRHQAFISGLSSSPRRAVLLLFAELITSKEQFELQCEKRSRVGVWGSLSSYRRTVTNLSAPSKIKCSNQKLDTSWTLWSYYGILYNVGLSFGPMDSDLVTCTAPVGRTTVSRFDLGMT